MRTDGRESDNVEDRRSEGGGRGLPGGVRIGRGGLGVGTIVLALVASYFLGIDPRLVMGVLGGGEDGVPTQVQVPSAPAPKPSDETGRFVAVVLADTEDTWRALFRQAGGSYREPKLVLFSGAYPTACGLGQSAAGPFYCPADQKLYIDLSFFRLLQERFRAPGDFAQAYVIAHEVGHHVQNLLGIMERTSQLRQRMSAREYNQVSVRVELQADCFAGLWAHHANRLRQILEPGDLEEALRAATAIGDDMLQKQSQGYAVPDSFTHGSSEQRVRWFRTGFAAGTMQACNTFDARTP
jgi:predicted metalloprotease